MEWKRWWWHFLRLVAYGTGIQCIHTFSQATESAEGRDSLSHHKTHRRVTWLPSVIVVADVITLTICRITMHFIHEHFIKKEGETLAIVATSISQQFRQMVLEHKDQTVSYVKEQHPRRKVSVITGYARTQDIPGLSGMPWGILVRRDSAKLFTTMMLIETNLALIGMSFVFPLIALLIFIAHRLQTTNSKTAVALKIGQTEKSKFQQIMKSFQNGIVNIDSSGLMMLSNKQMNCLFGYSPEEFFGQPIEQLILGSFRQRYSSLATQVLAHPTGNSIGVEEQLFGLRKDGTEFPLEIRLTSLETPQSPCLIATIRDVFQRKQLEVQLGLAQKMESIGQLAAGIAHEINTPTKFVSDNLRFLTENFRAIQKVLDVYDQVVKALPREAMDAQLLHAMDTTLAEADLAYVSEEIPKALQQSLDGSERVGKIVRAMKEFSHPGTAEKSPIDLNQTIESTITVARNEWKYVAEVVTEFEPTLPPVPCLPAEFNQVILNLLVNAAHAIGGAMGPESGNKGTISVRTRLVGEGVEIRITDTGPGIQESAHKKIFDPFFTTKEVGKGAGQGLAIAHDVIVNKHGGRLTFETTVGTGTTFIIQLPCQPTAVIGG